LYSNANLLDDVDPYNSHPQIIEYVHVLDPWGQVEEIEGEETQGK